MKSMPAYSWKKSLEEIIRSASPLRLVSVFSSSQVALTPLEIRQFVREMRRRRCARL
jgi:hypothetical protein